MTTKTKTKTLLIVVAVFGVLLFAVGFGLMVHHFNFPEWTRDVENLAIEYLSENEDILELYGNNLDLKYKGMTYNTKTKDSVVKVSVNGNLYEVIVHCVNNEFVVSSYQRIEE